MFFSSFNCTFTSFNSLPFNYLFDLQVSRYKELQNCETKIVNYCDFYFLSTARPPHNSEPFFAVLTFLSSDCELMSYHPHYFCHYFLTKTITSSKTHIYFQDFEVTSHKTFLSLHFWFYSWFQNSQRWYFYLTFWHLSRNFMFASCNPDSFFLQNFEFVSHNECLLLSLLI